MNIYDDPSFFEKYSQMERSQFGLDGAGEWPTLEPMLPDFSNKHVLDLGCGYGWHCQYAVKKGAASVIGVDVSEKMLEVAQEKFTSQKITFLKQDISAIDFDKEQFDIVFSSLAFHYVKDYNLLIEKISNLLKPEGELIFTVEHPVFTAYGSQDWIYDEAGEILHFPVDRYYDEGERKAVFLETEMKKYHRTLTTYLETLLQHNFSIERVVEPEPPIKFLSSGKRNNEMRRPMFLIVSAKKKR